MRRCAQAGVRRDVPAAAVEDNGEVKEWIFIHGCASCSCSRPCGALHPSSARTAAIVPGTRPQCSAQMPGCGRSQRGSHRKLSPFTWNATTSGTSQRVHSATWSTCATCTCPTTASTHLPRGLYDIWAPSCACWTSHTTS